MEHFVMTSLPRRTVSALYAKLIHKYLENCSLDLNDQQKLKKLFLNKSEDFGGQIAISELEFLIQETKSFFYDKPLGLEVGRHIHPSDFGIIGYALMNCKTLHHAFLFAVKYKHQLNSSLAINLSSSGEIFRFQMMNLMNSSEIGTLIELDFIAALQLSRYLVGSQRYSEVKFLQVNFQHAPQGRREFYRELFQCPVEFNQPTNEILFSKAIISLPVRSYDAQMYKMCMRKIRRLQNSKQFEDALHRQVFFYVSNHQESEPLNIQSISAHFNMSPSTFKKRLKSEGYHFSQICDVVQKSRAMKLVAAPAISLKEIGGSLGFSSPSAFNRAFKRWTDMTPAEYRRNKINMAVMKNTVNES